LRIYIICCCRFVDVVNSASQARGYRVQIYTDMDYLLERSVGIGMNGVSFSDHSYTDLDFADDVCLLAELLELLMLVLEAIATEAETLGL